MEGIDRSTQKSKDWWKTSFFGKECTVLQLI